MTEISPPLEMVNLKCRPSTPRKGTKVDSTVVLVVVSRSRYVEHTSHTPAVIRYNADVVHMLFKICINVNNPMPRRIPRHQYISTICLFVEYIVCKTTKTFGMVKTHTLTKTTPLGLSSPYSQHTY